MFGKPMISSEIGTGTSYIKVDGLRGLVVPPGDPQAFAQAMRRLWQERSLAAQKGRRAAGRYAALFTSEQMAAGYTTLYCELAARAGLMADGAPLSVARLR